MKVTRIGGPTVLVELAGWRILVDPTFDPPGRRYSFGLGTSSLKTAGPALAAEEVGEVDVVLVSHDHHADNLDARGRQMLASAGRVLTTASGARRLQMTNVTGLRAGESTLLDQEGKPALRVTATTCRHGPPLSRALVGDVVGFAVRLSGRTEVALWVTGDTVLTGALLRLADALAVDVAIVNAGGVRFGISGPLTYTMTGSDAVRLIGRLRPRVAVPAHYDGWGHFRDGVDGMRAAVAAAPADVRERIRWLPDGVPVDI